MPPENPIGRPFFELSEVDSTNNYAMQRVQAQMAAHGATWFARYQNAGKGQRGKAWKAEPGQNIMMSSVLEPTFLGIDNQFLLNLTVALACVDFFKKYALSDVSVKWPNDVYWKDRKAGGILIENLLHGKDWKFAIAGIGININQTFFPDHLPNPVSLKQITGKTYDVIELAKDLCNSLNSRWNQLKTGEQTELFNDYSCNLYKKNETVTFKKNQQLFDAIVTGVTSQGELVLNNREITTHPFGSIEWVIPAKNTPLKG